MNALRDAFSAVLAGRSLDDGLAARAMEELFDSEVPEALAAAFLVALRMKGESASELTAAVRAMLKRARLVDLGTSDLLDVVGTGGDDAGLFNVSTGAAIVAATAGARVAKHGNRAVSGKVGAADVLERFGVRIDLPPEGLRRCLEEAGICFLFAPAFHPVMARFAGLRRTLGIRTLFNLLGPLSNPARPRRLLVGVAERSLLRPMAEAVAELGAVHALVVHSQDGLDEISIAAATRVAEVRAGSAIVEYQIAPEDYGVRPRDVGPARVSGAQQAEATLREALAGRAEAAQDLLALNAGAAIYVAGRARSLGEGVAAARAILAEGRALETIEKMRRASREEPA